MAFVRMTIQELDFEFSSNEMFKGLLGFMSSFDVGANGFHMQ